ncbi:MAG: hypothetical protein AAGD11_00465 [Planctomycetota bacterium]
MRSLLSYLWISSNISLMGACLIGCRGGWPAQDSPPTTFATSHQSPSDLSPTTENGTELDSGATDDEAALAEIVTELVEMGALDEQSKTALLSDLREADRDNWPMIVKQFRSTLAFRKQLAARETVDDKARPSALAHADSSAGSATRPPKSSPPTTRLASTDKTQSKTSQSLEAVPAHEAEQVTSPPLRQPVPPVVLAKPPLRPVRQVSYDAPSSEVLGWRSHLQRAVLGLQAEAQASPASPDEVNEHLQLRLLQLLAGDEEAALAPVPGASAEQQDYWNHQLFALSTYLDGYNQPDNKRRATGSLTHLDLARSKLAELAMLQVRSLAFVESVEGYGAYDLLSESKFRPGQEVTLYAEIENFSSQSTKDGQRTRLGTSFEIVDGNGKRVDSAQFPEVEDLCQTKRRDFHMQYTITLPERIYPDSYEIRLIVTDQQSHKIGQASLPFEIID